MTRRRKRKSAAQTAALALTDEMRELFGALVPEDWRFTSGRIWKGQRGCTLVFRFLTPEGTRASAKLKVIGQSVVDRSVDLTWRLR